jgi:hypothetical protein
MRPGPSSFSSTGLKSCPRWGGRKLTGREGEKKIARGFRRREIYVVSHHYAGCNWNKIRGGYYLCLFLNSPGYINLFTVSSE